INKGTAFGSSAVQVPVKEIKNGVASLGVTLTGTSSNGVTLNGTLAVIKAKVNKSGQIKLNFTNSDADLSLTGNTVRVKLSNANSGKINYTSANAVQNVGGTVPTDDKSTLTSFKADKPNGQKVGTSITFTATATPDKDTLYSFYVMEGVSSWVKMQNYSSNNTFKWTPSTSNVYKIRVHAKHKNSTAASDGFQDILFVIKDNTAPVVSKLTSFTTDKASGQALGTTINLKASANPASKALYSFYVKAPGSSTWERIQDYSFKNNVNWTPTAKGTYTLRVHCMNINSPNAATDGSKDMTFEIK
ncbi:MAG: triple tyrosine motif-containing protein, partial [Clostridium sp.]